MYLDKKRPYGTIYGVGGSGHFEQDGKLFDVNGHPVIEVLKVSEKQKTQSDSQPEESPARKFIIEKLSQGEMGQGGFFKLATETNISWPDIQAEFERMGGLKLKNKGETIWKLPDSLGAAQ